MAAAGRANTKDDDDDDDDDNNNNNNKDRGNDNENNEEEEEEDYCNPQAPADAVIEASTVDPSFAIGLIRSFLAEQSGEHAGENSEDTARFSAQQARVGIASRSR